MKYRQFIAIAMVFGLGAGANAQQDVDEKPERQPGRLVARTSAEFPAPQSISLQLICYDQYADRVRQAIARELISDGWAIVDGADLILRIAASPCETDLATKPVEPRRLERVDRPQASAETGTSGQPVSQVRIPIGKATQHRTRISLVLQLFESGGAPSWAAEVSTDRHLRAQGDQLVRLASIGMEAFGQTIDRRFEGP